MSKRSDPVTDADQKLHQVSDPERYSDQDPDLRSKKVPDMTTARSGSTKLKIA
jgi:hypothetical protein